MDIEQEILEIKQRNRRVETDKLWETSVFRRVIISIFTYIIAEAWLLIISEPNSWYKAAVPVAGYILSTFSLPWIKKRWLDKINN